MPQKETTPKGKQIIILVVLIVAAVAIFIVGTTNVKYQSTAQITSEIPFDDHNKNAGDIRAYSRLRDVPLFETVDTWLKDKEQLEIDTPKITDNVNFEGSSKERILAKRAINRAYEGAPPSVPHPVIQSGTPDCLACHEKGIKIRGRTASKISHDILQNCSQCHTGYYGQSPPGKDGFSAGNILLENSFKGQPSPIEGPRAYSIAPPQIPHRTLMRANCDSCHGVNGETALRSSHPERFNCQQCHTSAALDDQR